MTISSGHTPEFAEYIAEFVRVCPKSVDLLTDPAPTPTDDLQRGLAILRTLPDGAGLTAFMRAWRDAFDPDSSHETDFVVAVGDGAAVGPPPAPVTADDYYRAVLLMGMSEEDARQIADDFAPAVEQPGGIWVGDTLLYVALLSPDHEERIRGYLKADPEQMAHELDRVRRSIADREHHQSSNRDRAT